MLRVVLLRSRAFSILMAVVALGVLALAAVAFLLPAPSALLKKAQRALLERRPADALRFARQILARKSGHVRALLIAAAAAERLDRIEEALSFAAQVPDSASPNEAIQARVLAGELLLRQRGQLTAAEEQFQRVLVLDANHVLAHDRLAYLYGVSTQYQAMVPQQIAMLRLGEITPQRLYLLSLGERLPTDAEAIRKLAVQAPDDPLVLAGLAQLVQTEQQFDKTKELLERAVAAAPQRIEIQVQLGRFHLDHGSATDLARWWKTVPAEAESCAPYWMIRGLQAGRSGNRTGAARCFWEAVRRDADHQEANYQLGQTLLQLGRASDAEAFLNRARLLEQYVNHVFANALGADGPAAAREFNRAAELAQSLGLMWEAFGWRQLTSQAGSADPFAKAPLNESRFPAQESRCDPTFNPAQRLDLSDYPLPDLNTGDAGSRLAAQSPTSVTFADQAVTAGIDFSYFNGNPPGTIGKRIYESIGGGVGVLDYDGDGLPDLHLTQGCILPSDAAGEHHLDRLFRNAAAGVFTDVTEKAHIFEDSYSQGVACGDFDNDGFPDLYVANLGANRFFHNNGDGTFEDVTAATGTAGADWSTSCVLADINGDALPDLYVVNYLAGDEILTRICRSAEGDEVVCPPNMFAAATDRLYLNQGDGSFHEVGADAGIRKPDGRGLGIVALRLNGMATPSLFVANDQSANFLFVPQQAGPAAPSFSDEGLVRGVAYSGLGRAQASMGVAAGDSDGNGLIDLLVTNFAEEGSTLYLQGTDGNFRDATREAGLFDPTWKMLGFGTQFLDGELDGWLDLFVTNGHIDDRSKTGELFRMPSQYFQNLGQGRFRECNAAALGAFFEGRHLGRGLARLDWNADGREDVAISHLDGPFALLKNTTTPHGHFLSVRLRGVDSSRDAIGAVVQVRTGDRALIRQLTAGDGYQASNERRLTFGLGTEIRVSELTIQWPSGRIDSYADLAADADLLCIEGRANPLLLAP